MSCETEFDRTALTIEVRNATMPGHYMVEKIFKLEQERNRLRDALKSIAANSCCDKCQEAALVARKVLTDT